MRRRALGIQSIGLATGQLLERFDRFSRSHVARSAANDALFLPGGEPLVHLSDIDHALDSEDRIDSANYLDSDRRDDGPLLSALLDLRSRIGVLREFDAHMIPAQGVSAGQEPGRCAAACHFRHHHQLQECLSSCADAQWDAHRL